MNSQAVFTADDLNSKRLLILSTGTTVHLWNLQGKLGYLDRVNPGRNRWVWLAPEKLPCIHRYFGSRLNVAVHPADFVLDELVGKGVEVLETAATP